MAPPGQGLPPIESCTSTLTTPPDIRNYFNVGAGVNFQNGAVSVPATYQAVTGWYSSTGLDGAQFLPNSSWSVLGAVDPIGCSMDLASIVSAPDDPTLIQPNPFPPANTVDCWTAASELPGVVQWSAPATVGPNDGVLIQISEATSGAGLICHAADDGAFLVSFSDQLLMTQGLQYVSVIRYRPTEMVVEPSGATAHGTYSSDMTGLMAFQVNYGTYVECP